jgi:hypothetical protein
MGLLHKYIHSKPVKTETEKSIIAAMNVISKGKFDLVGLYVLFIILIALEKGDHQTALNSAMSLANRLSDMRKLPSKENYRSDVYNILGTIYMEMGNLPQSIQYHRKGGRKY